MLGGQSDPRGGGTQVLNGYRLPNGHTERRRQNIEAVNLFEGKKEGQSTSNLEPNKGTVTCKMCLFSIYFVKYMIFIT